MGGDHGRGPGYGPLLAESPHRSPCPEVPTAELGVKPHTGAALPSEATVRQEDRLTDA